MSRYTTTVALQPSQLIPAQHGCKAYILNNHPILYTTLRALKPSTKHPSLTSHPVSSIYPWPLDAILLPTRAAYETPLDRLYIMYHYIVRRDYTILRNEVQDFFDHHAWHIANIPDPKDYDPERYAILAVIVRYLAHGFNRRIRIGGQSRRDGKELGEWSKAAWRFFCGTRGLEWREGFESEPRWVEKVPRIQGLYLSRGSGGVRRGKRSWRFEGKGIVAEEIVECFI